MARDQRHCVRHKTVAHAKRYAEGSGKPPLVTGETKALGSFWGVSATVPQPRQELNWSRVSVLLPPVPLEDPRRHRHHQGFGTKGCWRMALTVK